MMKISEHKPTTPTQPVTISQAPPSNISDSDDEAMSSDSHQQPPLMRIHHRHHLLNLLSTSHHRHSHRTTRTPFFRPQSQHTAMIQSVQRTPAPTSSCINRPLLQAPNRTASRRLCRCILPPSIVHRHMCRVGIATVPR